MNFTLDGEQYLTMRERLAHLEDMLVRLGEKVGWAWEPEDFRAGLLKSECADLLDDARGLTRDLQVLADSMRNNRVPG